MARRAGAVGRTAGALAERSPARHEEMVHAELRRNVVSWLLGESPFRGRPAVRVPPAPPDPDVDVTPDIEVGAALAAAPDIQFLEQCLEWSNLSWVCYPYYWADRDRWAQLADLETVDPQLGQFLRAGSSASRRTRPPGVLGGGQALAAIPPAMAERPLRPSAGEPYVRVDCPGSATS